MAKKRSSHFFKKPHQEEFIIGKIPVTAEYVTSEKYPITCEAFSSLCNCEIKDDMIRRQGTEDNYIESLKGLMNAFDAFVQEFTGKKLMTGDRKNFDLTHEDDFTIFLLWQIRHVLIHRAGRIDERCIRNYENIFSDTSFVHPQTILPLHLELGQEFDISFNDYCVVRQCVMKFIQKKVSQEDFEIIKKRAAIKLSDVQGIVCFSVGKFEFFLNIDEITPYEFEIDLNSNKLIPPPNTTFSESDGRIYLEDGRSFPVKYKIKS